MADRLRDTGNSPLTAPSERALNALYREALREAETRMQNCWNAGQTFGYVREQAELGLIEVRAALEAVNE